MPDDNPHLRHITRSAAAESPQADDEAGLPSLDEKQYVAHARAANKPLYAIHFVNPRGDVRSFQYMHLDSNSSYTAEGLTLTFLGMEPMKVVIKGRNLWRLYDYVHQHRMAWVMQASRDFAKDGQAMVTQVSFIAVKDGE